VSFAYTSTGDNISAHNLTKLVDAAGQTYVQNVYADDRVVSQTYGDGTLAYTYSIDDETGRVKTTSVTDKEGNKSEYTYDEN
jgi:hypothetical protein